MSPDTPPAESIFQSFVVKIWLEESDTGSPGWRGRVTHIPSYEQRYVTHLDEITDFIAPYLEAAGVKTGLRRRIRRWLSSQTQQS
jgi:hypothetical protein